MAPGSVRSVRLDIVPVGMVTDDWPPANFHDGQPWAVRRFNERAEPALRRPATPSHQDVIDPNDRPPGAEWVAPNLIQRRKLHSRDRTRLSEDGVLRQGVEVADHHYSASYLCGLKSLELGLLPSQTLSLGVGFCFCSRCPTRE